MRDPCNAASAATSNSSSDQRARVLSALRKGPHSTLDLRRQADVLCPASRVMELRRAGADIVTTWDYRATESGRFHRVGVYVLMKDLPRGSAP